MTSSDSAVNPPVGLTFLGCYTNGAAGAGEGIVRVCWDTGTGALREPDLVAATPAPSFLARHPGRPMLYAVNELDDGAVSAFAVAPDGTLTPSGTWPSGGSYPCHLTLDLTGRHLLIANYGSGTVTALVLGLDGVPTGRSHSVSHSVVHSVSHSVSHSGCGEHPERQEGPHAHAVAAVADGVLAVDLGVDTVFHYRLDPDTGQLGAGEVAFRASAGTGPRHLAWDQAGRLHLVGELDASVTTYQPGTDGWRAVGRVPTSVVESALPSELRVSGGFLYVANRGPDTISTFSLATGLPVFVGEVSSGGAWPRHFAINGGFLAVANQRGDSVVSFRLDPVTGLPTPTGDIIATPTPTFVLTW